MPDRKLTNDWTEWTLEERLRDIALGIKEHGEPGYNRGCRCRICQNGHAAYMRDWLHRTGQNRPREVYEEEKRLAKKQR